MATHVLVAMDSSERATAALEHALTDHPDARLTVFHAIDPAEHIHAEDAQFTYDDVVADRREHAEQLFDRARELAAGEGREIETATEVGKPAKAIVDYADANDVDHIVVGSHGRSGVSRLLLGSVAEVVVRRASVPVTVVQ